MDIIKAVIVDDEQAAQNILKNLLKKCEPNIDIVGQCIDLLSAVEVIRQQQPSVVFLDVQMPNYAGYEIVNFFEEIDFEIIFVTAHDQYAIKAFELCAVDYLVKPIDRNRLKEAVKRLQQKLSQKSALVHYQLLLKTINGEEKNKIVISELVGGQILKKIIFLTDIIAAEANGAYSKLYLKKGAILTISRNLSHLEGRLPMELSFFRSHRSWIINLAYVKSYSPKQKDIVLGDGLTVKLSKKRQTFFEQRIVAHS